MKKIFGFFFIVLLVLSFFWFVDRARAYQVEERWVVSSDPPSQYTDDTGFKSDGSNVVYDDEGNGVDPGDTVVDDNVEESDTTFYIRMGVTFYKVIYKKAVWTQGVGFKPMQAIQMNLCGEYEDEYVKVERIGSFQFELQNIISSGDVIENVVGYVSVCLNIDFIEWPSSVKTAKVYVDGVEVRPSVYGETHLMNIPAGRDVVKRLGITVKYFSEDEGIWREHILNNKIEIQVKWKPIQKFQVGYQGMDLVSWCIELYSDDVGPLRIFKTQQEVQQFCRENYGSVNEYVYIYDVASAAARKV